MPSGRNSKPLAFGIHTRLIPEGLYNLGLFVSQSTLSIACIRSWYVFHVMLSIPLSFSLIDTCFTAQAAVARRLKSFFCLAYTCGMSFSIYDLTMSICW
jgi:hypothetical protein